MMIKQFTFQSPKRVRQLARLSQLPILVFILSLAIVSCNKDAIQEDQPNEATAVSLTQQGFLHFSTHEDFVDLIQELTGEKNRSSYVSNRFPGFTSYTEVYASLDFAKLEETGAITSRADYAKYPVVLEKGDDGEVSVEPIVEGYYLGFLTDKNGVVQIGAKVYQVSREFVLIDAYSNVKDFSNLANSPTAQRETIERQNGSFSHARSIETCKDDYYWAGSDHRLKGTWATASAIVYSDITVSTKHQKRGFLGIWYPNNEQYIEVSGDVNFTQDGVNHNEVFFESETNSADVKRVLEWCANVKCKFTFKTGSESDHESSDSGTAASCSITN